MWAIGNDGGYLDKPSIINPNAAKPMTTHLVIMPGERYEVIVDFSKVAGQTLILKNTAKAPFPGGATPHGTTTGQIMQFRVSATRGRPTRATIPRRASRCVHAASSASRTPAPSAGRPGREDSRADAERGRCSLRRRRSTRHRRHARPIPGGPVEILVNNTLWSGRDRRARTTTSAGHGQRDHGERLRDARRKATSRSGRS